MQPLYRCRRSCPLCVSFLCALGVDKHACSKILFTRSAPHTLPYAHTHALTWQHPLKSRPRHAPTAHFLNLSSHRQHEHHANTITGVHQDLGRPAYKRQPIPATHRGTRSVK